MSFDDTKKINDAEYIVRALHMPSWDEKLKRGTKSAFQKNNISVSRLSVLSIAEILQIWREEIETESRKIEAYAKLKVADVHALSGEVMGLVVIEDVTASNRSHAEIVGHVHGDVSTLKDITNGIANRLAQVSDVITV